MNIAPIAHDGYLTGRPVALYVLDYGLFRVRSNGRVIGICGYLIRTDAGENILVDTGFPVKYAKDHRQASVEDKLGLFGEVLHCGPDNRPGPQLERAGISPGDVTLQILTHSHIDHIGGLADFPDVPILMAAAERALPAPLYWGDTRPVGWPEASYLTLDRDLTLGPGFEILLVPGHAPGQLAICLDLPETGPVLLTGDAISRPAEIDEGFAGSWDVTQARHHGARLMRLATERSARVIYGHCPDQWPVTPKAPERYR